MSRRGRVLQYLGGSIALLGVILMLWGWHTQSASTPVTASPMATIPAAPTKTATPTTTPAPSQTPTPEPIVPTARPSATPTASTTPTLTSTAPAADASPAPTATAPSPTPTVTPAPVSGNRWRVGISIPLRTPLDYDLEALGVGWVMNWRAYANPPVPLRQFLGVDLWVLRDSNWSPDFPTAAQRAVSLYRPGYDAEIDGVIAVDQHAVQQLVAALGPLTVPGVDEPVTGSSIIDYMRQAWAPDDGEIDREWWRQRKDFIGGLAQAALAQLQSGQVDARALASNTLQMLEEKHLLITVDQAQVARLLEARGWDGGLQTPQGDYLMLVEANLGYNKASVKVERRVHYEVDLTLSPPQAALTLAYTHTSQVDYPCTPEVRYDPIYAQMMDRCYWAYLRLYLPHGAELQSASRHPIPATAVFNGERWAGTPVVTTTAEHTVIGQAFLLPTASQTEVTFHYTLPEKIVSGAGVPQRYRLDLQKQPGIRSLPVEVTVRLPADAEIISPIPPTKGGEMQFFTDLRQDTTLELKYRATQER